MSNSCVDVDQIILQNTDEGQLDISNLCGLLFQSVCGNSETDPFEADGHVFGTTDSMKLKFGLVQHNWNSLPPPVQYCKKVTLKQGIKEKHQNDKMQRQIWNI